MAVLLGLLFGGRGAALGPQGVAQRALLQPRLLRGLLLAAALGLLLLLRQVLQPPLLLGLGQRVHGGLGLERQVLQPGLRDGGRGYARVRFWHCLWRALGKHEKRQGQGRRVVLAGAVCAVAACASGC